MGELEPNCMRIEGMGIFFDYEGLGKPLKSKDWVRLIVYLWKSSGWLEIHHPMMTKQKWMGQLEDEEMQLDKWRYCRRLENLMWIVVWRVFAMYFRFLFHVMGNIVVIWRKRLRTACSWCVFEYPQTDNAVAVWWTLRWQLSCNYSSCFINLKVVQAILQLILQQPDICTWPPHSQGVIPPIRLCQGQCLHPSSSNDVARIEKMYYRSLQECQRRNAWEDLVRMGSPPGHGVILHIRLTLSVWDHYKNSKLPSFRVWKYILFLSSISENIAFWNCPINYGHSVYLFF